MKITQKIKKVLDDILFVSHRELKNIFRDSGVVIFFFLVPLVYPVLYGIIYNNEVVRDVPLAVVNNSNSQISREFIRKIDASPDVKVECYCTDIEEAKQFLNEGKVYGILYVPEQFNKDIQNNIQTPVKIFCDMGSLLHYKAILLTVTDVSLDLGNNIRIEKITNTIKTSKMQEIENRAVPYENVTFYNSQNGFASFLLPAVLILVIQQTLVLGIGMLAATAREKNYARQLVPANIHYSTSIRIMLGKALAYILLYIPISAWALIVVPKIFGLPQLVSPLTLWAFILPFLLASIFFAMSISCFLKEREQPMLVLVFTSLIFLFLSGVSWPICAMPKIWQYLGMMVPSTFGVQGFIKLNSMGANISEVAFEYRMLWIQTGVYFICTYILYKFQLTKYREMKEQRLRELNKEI